MAMNNPYLLTLPQLMSAKKKIGQVSAFYDPTKTSLKGFESAVLTPTEFREQLRRNLGIIVTDAELGALVFLFDKTGDGVVDSVQFVNEFFRLGKQERAKFSQTHADEKLRISEWKAKNKEKKEKKFEHFTYTKVATSWTEEQETEAIRKIAHVAFTYDPIKGALRPFISSNQLTASEFRELMRRNFEVYLSPEETGALLRMFDRDGLGLIDCKEFTYQFFRIGRSEKDNYVNRNVQLTEKRNSIEKQRVEQIADKYAKSVIARMTPAKESERQSAFEKIRHAAMCYKGDSAFSGNLWKSFESDALSPTMFKTLLKTNFEILLSPGELNAVVQMFDENGDGRISCVEFITTFFRIALNERSHRLAIKREKDLKAIHEREEMVRAHAANAMTATATRVVYPMLPNENGEFPDAHEARIMLPQIATDPKIIMRSRARPSMQEILSPTKGGGMGSIGSRGSGGYGGIAHAFPKASQDTKDFLLQLELQEREIKLMGKSMTSSSLGEDTSALSTGKGKRKKKRVGSSIQGSMGDMRGRGGMEDTEQYQANFTGSLLDRQWGFASGNLPMSDQLDASRPGTSAGDVRAERSSSVRGDVSRGHGMGGSSHRIVPSEAIEEEFGSISEGIDIPVLAAEEVDDEC